jgi:methylphosphotriester-DNA--protein-cysteine methyltransferase
MNKADGQDTADRLSAIVANSLDTQAKTQDLARQAYQSRTQFHRLFRTVVEETPGAMRRRLLLERAAYHPGRQLRFVGGVHSRFPKSFSDFSQPLPAHA